MPDPLRIGLCFLIMAGGTRLWSQQYVISTVAGVPPTRTSTPALGAGIGSPARVAVDASGNVYFNVTSQTAAFVYKVDTNGDLWHVTGQLRAGYSGDGGLAANAALSPSSIALTRGSVALAVDKAGNLYIADTNNHRVRKVTAEGMIMTVAGTGVQGFSGDGGPATSARLAYPSGVAVDTSGNLFIADTNNSCIRKVVPDGTITTVAGGNPISTDGWMDVGDNGPANNGWLNDPTGLAIDPSGNLYIADTFNNRIRKVSADGIITTIAGTGPPGWNFYYGPTYQGDGSLATKIFLKLPVSVAVDGAGNVYIPDRGALRKVSPNGTTTTVAGSSRVSSAQAVASDVSGNLWVADSSGNRIWKLYPSGIATVVAGNGWVSWWTEWQGGFSGDFGPATSARLNFPSALALDALGDLYIADAGNHRIRKVSPEGQIRTIAGTGVAAFGGDGGAAASADLNWPSGVALDDSGNLFVADSNNYRIRRISSDGVIATVIGNGAALDYPSNVPNEFIDLGWNRDTYHAAAMAVDASGKLHIVNVNEGVAVDTSTGAVYFTQSDYSRVLKTPGYVIVAGNSSPGYSGDQGPAAGAQLQSPRGLAVDGAGNLYIADCLNNRIRKVSGGIIHTIAGDGTPGYSGDGGPAIAAQLNCPTALAVDKDGNIYVAEPFSGLVRVLRPVPRAKLPDGVESMVFANFSPGDELVSPLYGYKVGYGSTLGNAGVTVAVRFSPSATMALSHVEVVASRQAGSSTLHGYLMADEHGPGTVIEQFTFTVPASYATSAPVLAASSALHPALRDDRRYWFALAPPDLVQDSYFWVMGPQRPGGVASYRIGDTGEWVQNVPSTCCMLRIYGVDTPVSMKPPAITAVASSASGRPGAVAGSLVSIYGSNFTAVPFSDWSGAIVNDKLPLQLGGVSVLIGGKSAFLATATPTQINLQAPDVRAGPVTVTVMAPGGVSAPFTATAQITGPAFFVWQGNQAAATHLDFSFAAKPGTFPDAATAAAKPGEIVTLWGTGFGPTDPAVPSGQVPTVAAPPTRFPVSVTLGGAPAPVIGAVLSGFGGLYQIAIQIPASTPDGDHAVIASVNGTASPSTVFLAVHR